MNRRELAQTFVNVIPRSMWAMRHEVRKQVRTNAQSELTVPQFRVLAQVSEEPKTLSQLAEAIGTSVPAMSRMVDCLVRRNLLKRTAGEKDRRQVRVDLSVLGRKRYDDFRQRTYEEFAESFKKLSESDRDTLIKGLRVLERFLDMKTTSASDDSASDSTLVISANGEAAT